MKVKMFPAKDGDAFLMKSQEESNEVFILIDGGYGCGKLSNPIPSGLCFLAA